MSPEQGGGKRSSADKKTCETIKKRREIEGGKGEAPSGEGGS